jgi:hypothetical protein
MILKRGVKKISFFFFPFFFLHHHRCLQAAHAAAEAAFEAPLRETPSPDHEEQQPHPRESPAALHGGSEPPPTEVPGTTTRPVSEHAAVANEPETLTVPPRAGRPMSERGSGAQSERLALPARTPTAPASAPWSPSPAADDAGRMPTPGSVLQSRNGSRESTLVLEDDERPLDQRGDSDEKKAAGGPDSLRS